MTKATAEHDFWTSLCADVQAAGVALANDPPKTTTAIIADEFVIRSNVPGFDSKDITVTWDADSVRIAGALQPTVGGFSAFGAARDFVLRCPVPPGFDTARLRARLSLGVLVVTVPPHATGAPVHPTAPVNAAN